MAKYGKASFICASKDKADKQKWALVTLSKSIKMH